MKRSAFSNPPSAAATALVAPRIVGTESAKTITFVPLADLASLDPVWTTADITRNYALAVLDTLSGYDAAFNAQPQMVERHSVNDGKQRDLTLRDGLKFHDGSSVLARDCVATIRLRAKRYPTGGALMARTDEPSTVSDKVIRFRSKRPFALLTSALAEPYCSILPERLAETTAFEQIKEAVGSGPLRFVAAERGPCQPCQFVVRLAHRSENGSAARSVVRRAGPRSATENLPRDAAFLAESVLRATRHVRPAGRIPSHRQDGHDGRTQFYGVRRV